MTKNKELKYNFIADINANVLCVNTFVKIYGNNRLKPGQQDVITFSDNNGDTVIKLFYKKLPFEDAIINGEFYDDMDCWLEGRFKSGGYIVNLIHNNNIKPLNLFIEPYNPLVNLISIVGDCFHTLLIENNRSDELFEQIKHFCEYVAEMK